MEPKLDMREFKTNEDNERDFNLIYKTETEDYTSDGDLL